MEQQSAGPERRTHQRRALDMAQYLDHADHAFPVAAEPGSLEKSALLSVLNAVRDGDVSVRLPRDWTGLDGKIADVFNDIVCVDERLTKAIEQVSLAVGSEGKLGQRLNFDNAAGAWGVKVDAVNALIDNLVQPVRDAGRVIGAVARGVLTQRMELDIEGRPLRGEFVKNANTINTMLDQLNSFSSEVSRVAREVGTEGKLGGQAEVQGVSGVWKDLTDNVNLMASNLTGQVRNIAAVTTAVANGDLSKTITVDVRGEVLQLKETINTMVDQLNGFAGEVTRVAREVGTEGRLGGQAYVPAVAGVWKDLTDNVNLMASNLTGQVRNIATVTTAVANGDLSRKITVDVKGEILELKNTINIMVDQLNAFGAEVTRVAREVGTEGKLGGQAQVKGVSGVWKDLTDSVNLMADNLTDQVRGIARVVTGVAVGNLKQKMMVPAKGEVAALAEIINGMVDTLATFSDQVTRVAREVGVEGRLGGQAVVPGAAGSWRDLVDNVNELAANLTTQVRAIGEVATAVTKGDLMRSIQMAARGEVADLKDKLNQMIRNLQETTERNTEQDWLKSNLARLTRMLQGQRDINTVARMLLSELAPLVASQHAVLYLMQTAPVTSAPGAGGRLRLMASYGYQERKNLSQEWRIGEGVVGQAAFEKQRILITNLPDDYVQIVSGLGQAAPHNIIVLPILFEGHVMAVIEIAAFERFQAIHLNFLDQLAEGLGIVFNSIESASNTEALLLQSQSLAGELKTQQEELQLSNAELEQKALQLASQNAEVERKNREIEVARASLQEKAEQLALTSKYKSEFLANMSHELRTPLNSLLLLAEQMRLNREQNLTAKQLEMVQFIHASGSDLLHLINDILDLSKIESGSVTLEIDDLPCVDLADHMEKTFHHLAEAKGLAFKLDFAPTLPLTVRTDAQRRQQVLKNLLSNAIKFTARGAVTLTVAPARSGWNRKNQVLERAPLVLAFSVNDTGIGIAHAKQKLIFEAFQQGDTSTSRRYGGTGLGLAISREIAYLLGGEICMQSEEGVGSTFIFYLPQQLAGAPALPSPRQAQSQPRPRIEAEPPAARAANANERPRTVLRDDRTMLAPEDPLLLIIEDDPAFARCMQDMAQEFGFKTLHTVSGEEGMRLAQKYQPDAITLDLVLPDADGWNIADRLKAEAATDSIPVHVISVRDLPPSSALHGVASYTAKPADLDTLKQIFAEMTRDLVRPIRALLVIEQDSARQGAIMNALKSGEVELDAASSAVEALAALHRRRYDGIVLDLDLPDMDGMALLQGIRTEATLAQIPAVVFSKRAIAPAIHEQITALNAVFVAEEERSLECLKVEVTQFLHRVKSRMPENKQQMLEHMPPAAGMLEGRRVLIVDDDARNLFAMTGLLENAGMLVVAVNGGAEAIERLHALDGIDVVLMDIMMPDMDGYEAMQKIRADLRFKDLPIIALTAKAMKGDREKCLEAGASDYASKPVDSAQLLSQLRAWLPISTVAAPPAPLSAS